MYALLSISMYTSKEKIRKALNLFKDQGGILRTSEVLSAGIHPRTLYKLRDEGYIIKLDRGVYKLNDHTFAFKSGYCDSSCQGSKCKNLSALCARLS